MEHNHGLWLLCFTAIKVASPIHHLRPIVNAHIRFPDTPPSLLNTPGRFQKRLLQEVELANASNLPHKKGAARPTKQVFLVISLLGTAWTLLLLQYHFRDQTNISLCTKHHSSTHQLLTRPLTLNYSYQITPTSLPI